MNNMLINFRVVLSALVLAFCSCTVLSAQHAEENHVSHDTETVHDDSDHTVAHHAEHGKHKVALFVGFTYVSAAFYEEETHEKSIGKWIPTLGAEYYYTLNSKFDVGVIGDVELDSYLISLGEEDGHSTEGPSLNRANVVVLSGVLRYKPIERLGIFLGPGFESEFSDHSGVNTLWVAKFGVDYEVEIRKGWELTPTFSFDLKEHYSTCAFGMTLGKRF